MFKKLKQKIRQFLQIFSTRYRIQVLDDEHFENKAQFRMSALQVFSAFSTLLVLFVLFTIYLVAFTSLREYIPGYADQSSKRKVADLTLVTDSIEQSVKANSIYIENLQNILLGKLPKDSTVLRDTTQNYKNLKNTKSKEDSILRAMVEKEDQYNISSKSQNKFQNLLLFKPTDGKILQKYDYGKNQLGITISGKKDDIIKSVMEGTVILATWTPDDEYVIAIQHDQELISIYKNNSSLLKKPGEIVRSGEPIAFIGNGNATVKESFVTLEIWYKGFAMNPESFIKF